MASKALPVDNASMSFIGQQPMTPQFTGVLRSELAGMLIILSFSGLSQVISFFGIIFNIINIIVFAKLGFKETINISLCGLAISDLFTLISLFWMGICHNPLFIGSSVNFEPKQVQYLTAGWPYVCFARVTGWITGFITFERCLCIALPLRVKTILTPLRVQLIIGLIYATTIATVIPVFFVIDIGYPGGVKKDNTSRMGLVYKEHSEVVENVASIFNVIFNLASLFLVITCTSIMINSLRHKTKWRQSAVGSESKAGSASSKELKVIKMVVFISSIFIVSFFPSAVSPVAMVLVPEYSIVGKYRNMFSVTWGFNFTLGATNSAVNIFVYYNMSTKYKEVFLSLFCQNTREKK